MNTRAHARSAGERDLERLRRTIEAALQMLEELSEALSSGDQRKIGARLYELHRTLQEVHMRLRAVQVKRLAGES